MTIDVNVSLWLVSFFQQVSFYKRNEKVYTINWFKDIPDVRDIP